MPFRFPIRTKVLLGLVLPALCLAGLTAYSFANLRLIEERIDVLGRIDEAERSIMEIRRQGKLFLFYGDQADYDAVFAESGRAVAILDGTRELLLFEEPRAMLEELVATVRGYAESIRAVKMAAGQERSEVLRLKSEAHKFSMASEEQVMSLSAAVRERIGYISATLRTQLLIAALGVAGLFALMGYYISSRVLKPLKIIENTTRQIGKGKFTHLPLSQTRDEIRDLQEAFNRMVSELESRQEQLVQSQKLSSIGILSAGIAHQLNNPLNNISLSAQMARHKFTTAANPASANPALEKALENIEKESDRARDIVRGLLNFSRQSDFCLQRSSLAQVVDNAVRLASVQCAPDVRIETHIPADVRLDIDPQRMSEALLNIVMNALQALGKGPGCVRLYLASPSSAAMVTLAVEDTGPGIAPEDLPHIFDPFFTKKEVGQGTGLGLSVGYGIIEACGGKLRAESQPGKGTCFFIDLPLPASDGPQAG